MRELTETRRATRLAAMALVLTMLVVLILSMVPAASAASSGAMGGAMAPARQAALVPSSTLQDEIDAVAAGTTLHLPAGTFVGQLLVDKNVTIIGAGEGKTILQSPASMEPDDLGNVFVVEVAHHTTVQLTALTIRVTEQCMLSNSIGVATGGAVGVRDSSTLGIWAVRAVAYGPSHNLNQPCTTHGKPGMLSYGRAVSIGLDDPPSDGTIHEVQGHGFVHDIQTAGFDIFSISVGGVRGPTGSTASIIRNTVQVGPGPFTAAYGIVVYGVSLIANNLVTGEAGSDGGIAVVITSAAVVGNDVENFTCTTAPFPITPPCGVDPFFSDQDLGIFLASITAGTVVAHNTIEHTDSGILVEGPGAPAQIARNSITGSTFYGLELIDAKQTFRNDVILGGLYAVAVGAEGANTTAILAHDTISGYTVALGLLQANYPWAAKLVVRAS